MICSYKIKNEKGARGSECFGVGACAICTQNFSKLGHLGQPSGLIVIERAQASAERRYCDEFLCT
jgi:hypothetical protein